MSILVDPHLPMDEVDLAALGSAAEARIEEASQTLLEAVDLPHSISETDTLLQIHELVFNHLLSMLAIEIDKLIPETPGSDQRAQTDARQRKIQFLFQFQRLLIQGNDNQITGGYVSHFVMANNEESESACKKVFDNTYKHQLDNGKISLAKDRLLQTSSRT